MKSDKEVFFLGSEYVRGSGTSNWGHNQVSVDKGMIFITLPTHWNESLADPLSLQEAKEISSALIKAIEFLESNNVSEQQ